MTGKPATTLDEALAAQLAETFKALGDATRVRIISALTGGERNVGEMAEALGLTLSATSHQLALLRRMRLVRARREGKQVYYALDDEHVQRLYDCGMEHVTHA
jgi:DNA-binding transcriptional ArsR family regulator